MRDGKIDHVNQIQKDMLRACMLDFADSYDMHLHLMEFPCNKCYQTMNVMTLFEVVYKKTG